MPPTSRRRIVRRAVMALAVVVLLLSAYLGSYWGIAWLAGYGSISRATFWHAEHTVYAPCMLWFEYNLPGADQLADFRNGAWWRGWYAGGEKWPQ